MVWRLILIAMYVPGLQPGPRLRPADRELLHDVPACLAGPLVTWPNHCGCARLDMDGDGHVDLRDAAAWQRTWVTVLPPFFWMCNTWQPGTREDHWQRLQWFRRWGHAVLEGPGVLTEAWFAQRLFDFDCDGDVDLRDFAALQRTVW